MSAAVAAESTPAAVPFLKWVGGKRQLLPELMKHVPPSYGTYHECFLGGGALFFALQPQRAALSDANERLIRTYRGVKNFPENVIGQLEYAATSHSTEFYATVRAQDPDHLGDVGVAAWFIYLNKTCFNGLYRVNQSDRFNVPIGKSKSPPNICDRVNLRACSAALAGATIRSDDFRFVSDRAEPGDLVYMDPPYVPVSDTADFTGYTADGFTARDQEELRDLALELKAKGVHVLLSNASVPAVHQLYAKGFEMRVVPARRALNSKASGRGPVGEVIIW